MKKLLIKIGFTDKITGVKYAPSEVVEFEDARAKELLADARNLVEVCKEAPAQAQAPKEDTKTVDTKVKKNKKETTKE